MNFREIMSGENRGVVAGGMRGLLAGAELVYSAVVSRRNRQYDRGGKPVHRVPATVVSIGNITAGGTGKTPLVAWLAEWISARAVRVALVSRGYGARPGEKNDEARELELRLPNVPHFQNADRVAAAQEAIRTSAARIVLLDDAFQHRRIERDCDIVLIDALEPFGYGRLLPRGLLREPLSSLRRAHVIALSRADLVPPERREEILATVREHNPAALWIEMAHRPSKWIGGEPAGDQTIERLRGARVAAFCGIGNPTGFRRTLEELKVTVTDFRAFPDHHSFSRADTDKLAERFDRLDVDFVLCTMKDYVKLHTYQLGRHRVSALQIDVEILSNRAPFESLLDALVARLREK